MEIVSLIVRFGQVFHYKYTLSLLSHIYFVLLKERHFKEPQYNVQLRTSVHQMRRLTFPELCTIGIILSAPYLYGYFRLCIVAVLAAAG